MPTDAKCHNTIDKTRRGDKAESVGSLVAYLLKTWKGSTFEGAPLSLLEEPKLTFSDPFEGQKPDEFDPFSSSSQKVKTDLKSPSLCTTHGQVKSPIRIKDLHQKAIIEWLNDNGHWKDGEKLSACGTSFIHLKCSNGHEKYVRAHCDKEYCPTCGEKGSHTHKRRAMRAVDRLMWAPVLGYLVFTLPREVSERRLDLDRLKSLRKEAYALTRKYFTTPGGLARYHLMGNTPGTFHTHLNVLFPITGNQGKGKVEQKVLDELILEYTKIVNKIFGLHTPVCNVNYTFAYKKPKMYHKIKYVLRPIVDALNFITMPEERKHQVLALEGWHNTTWWGELANSRYKDYIYQAQDERDLEEHIEKRDYGKCPVCDTAYHFIDIVSWADLPRKNLRYIDEDTFVDLPTFSFLKGKTPY